MKAKELQERLEKKEPLVVLDIRPAEQRQEWGIPGSLWIDAYHNLKAGDYQTLDNLELPAKGPVVVICGFGKTSRLAAEYLKSRGVEAYSLEGGMQAWSLAWNLAVRELSNEVKVYQVRRTGKGCLSYLIASEGDALVIDAAVDLEVYQKLAETYGLRLVGVLDTHIHADHLSRSRFLAENLDVPLYLPMQSRVQYSFRSLTDRDKLPFGKTILEVLHTPGHTWESCTYYLAEGAIFTGDTLFLEGIGRPDLEANREEARRRPQALFHSLKRLLTLPKTTRVFPGHSSSPLSFDGTPWTATLAEIETRVKFLHLSEETFIEALLASIPSTPPNYRKIVELNEEGRWPEEGAETLEAGANRCAVK